MSLRAPRPRRDFVKLFAFGLASSALLGQPWRRTLFAEATAASPNGSGLLEIRLSEYPALLDDFGSVRIGLNPISDDSTTPLGFFYPVLINRGANARFYALNSGCSHAGCIVPPYDPDGFITCPCHGSVYDIDGTVLQGPASRALSQMPVTYDGADTLKIMVPFLGYSLSGGLVGDPDMPRFELTFQTRFGVSYEVRFKSRMQDPWTVVPFATTPADPVVNTVLVGDDLVDTIYVERTTAAGFFSVGVQLLDLTII